MKLIPRSNPIAFALYVNAALLLAIVVLLATHGRPALASVALGDASAPQLPIAGGNGIYVMPCQLHPSVWGCMVMDTNRQTLAVYEYRAGEQSLVLTAGRDFGYDLQLKNFNTDPAPEDIKQKVEQQENNNPQGMNNPPDDARPANANPADANPADTPAVPK
ncbi:MAG: hypothetical protein ABSG31_18785 [Tepidisphaeraceae bacterium]|jgi:hypothetical protein